MNCLANKDTIDALIEQMSYSTLIADNVSQRVYSSFDGRIYAVLNKENKTVELSAYSWHEVKSFDTVQQAAKWLLQVAYERAKYFEQQRKKFS